MHILFNEPCCIQYTLHSCNSSLKVRQLHGCWSAEEASAIMLRVLGVPPSTPYLVYPVFITVSKWKLHPFLCQRSAGNDVKRCRTFRNSFSSLVNGVRNGSSNKRHLEGISLIRFNVSMLNVIVSPASSAIKTQISCDRSKH